MLSDKDQILKQQKNYFEELLSGEAQEEEQNKDEGAKGSDNEKLANLQEII